MSSSPRNKSTWSLISHFLTFWVSRPLILYPKTHEPFWRIYAGLFTASDLLRRLLGLESMWSVHQWPLGTQDGGRVEISLPRYHKCYVGAALREVQKNYWKALFKGWLIWALIAEILKQWSPREWVQAAFDKHYQHHTLESNSFEIFIFFYLT